MDPGEDRPPLTSGKVYVPTEKDRRIVEMMIAGGITQEGVARALGICVDTLVKNYRPEIDGAVDKANAQVAGSLFRKAVSDNHPNGVTAAIFWLKTRAKWRETSSVEVTGADGAPLGMVLGAAEVAALPDEKLEDAFRTLSSG
jgi:hypothetical protein